MCHGEDIGCCAGAGEAWICCWLTAEAEAGGVGSICILRHTRTDRCAAACYPAPLPPPPLTFSATHRYDTRRDLRLPADAPVIGLVMQRSHLVTGDEGHYSGVVAELEARGARVVPVFAGGCVWKEGRVACVLCWLPWGWSR